MDIVPIKIDYGEEKARVMYLAIAMICSLVMLE